MKRFVKKLVILAKGFLATARNVNVLTRGQSTHDNILQTAHRLEKGLTISKPRALWGWDKAKALAQLLEKGRGSFAYETGAGVLYAYLDAKKATGDSEEIQRADALCAQLQSKGILQPAEETGGALKLTAGDVSLSEEEFVAAQKLFFSRHSIRDYADKDVDNSLILQAIQIANRCPSACNRQPFHTYVMRAEDRERLGFRNEMGANKYILITGRISAFKSNELNDWIVSASIFAGYLSLALHAYGIGSCIMRKDLINETNYNKTMRNFCAIPANEQIVLELAIGHYKDEFCAPVSNRVSAEKIVSFIK